MRRIGDGSGLAVLFNGRARRVGAAVVHALSRALPKAMVLLSSDLDEARRHARKLAAARPEVILSGGGDGAAVRLVNLLREEGVSPLPPLGILKLGTGNAWAGVTGAGRYGALVAELPRLPSPLPTQPYDLVEVEGTLCHFAGVGWDARILNDYQRHHAGRPGKGMLGYLAALCRITIPEEWRALRREGQPRVRVESDDAVSTPDAEGNLMPRIGGRLLYEGPISVGAVGTTNEWGFGFRAFPLARKASGRINVRLYDRKVMEALRNAVHLWRGRHPQPGMHDFFTRRVTMSFSRPMPFQIGGDPAGLRERVEFAHASQTLPVVDWHAARAGA